MFGLDVIARISRSALAVSSVAAVSSLCLILVAAACSDSGSESPARAGNLNAVIGDGEWQLDEFIVRDEDVLIDHLSISLVLQAADRLSGFTGCDSYTALVRLEGSRLLTSELTPGERPCPTEAVAQVESLFLAALEQGGNLTVDHNRVPRALILTLSEGTALVFRPL